jgi:hypothetical protein
VIFLGPASVTGFREGRLVVALPPLNPLLAGDLVARSGFAEGLPEGERPALRAALSNALVRLSQLLTDIDEVAAWNSTRCTSRRRESSCWTRASASSRGDAGTAAAASRSAPTRRNWSSKSIGRAAGC